MLRTGTESSRAPARRPSVTHHRRAHRAPSQSPTGPRLSPPAPAAQVPQGRLLSSSLRGKGTPPRASLPLASPFTDALSTLNDRALRRLLGARAYLRGYDYVRRHAVEGIVIEDAVARGHVRGTDAEPYRVSVQLTPSGFSSSCTCPAFASSNGGHCKHVAALLIALRDQARGAQPRPTQPQSNGVHYTVHGGTVHVAGVEGEGRRSKRARGRAMKAAQHVPMHARVPAPAGPGSTPGCPSPCRRRRSKSSTGSR